MALELTQLAANRIGEIKEEQSLSTQYGVRLGVESGGCSGLSYVLELDQPEDDDRVFESHGVAVFCDPKSYLFINGTIVDYVDDLLNGGFQFENPNVSRSCGCGTSFAV